MQPCCTSRWHLLCWKMERGNSRGLDIDACTWLFPAVTSWCLKELEAVDSVGLMHYFNACESTCKKKLPRAVLSVWTPHDLDLGLELHLSTPGTARAPSTTRHEAQGELRRPPGKRWSNLIPSKDLSTGPGKRSEKVQSTGWKLISRWGWEQG